MGTETTEADRTIDAVRAVHDHVAARAATFDDDDLAAPSGASEWTVAQVLSHLGSQSEIGLGPVEAAVAGERPPPGDHQEIWDRWNALEQRAQADGYLEWAERQVEAYEALTPEQRAELRFELGFLPEPVGIDVVAFLRLVEYALHAWDVDVAAESGAGLHPATVPVLLDRLGLLVGFFGRADALDGETRLRVETTEPDAVVGLFVGDQVSLGEAPPADEADGVLRIPAEAWLRLLGGRLGPEHTPEGVELAADGLDLAALRRVFPGY